MHPITISADKLSFQDNGQPWIWRGTLDWPFYGRYLNEGDAVAQTIFHDRKAVGANVVCVAGMLEWWPGLNPSHPHYWDGWRPFVDLAASEGLRVCIVVFCDTKTLMPNPASHGPHWDRLLTTLGDKTNVFFVGVNQPGHPTQAIDPLVTHKLPNFPGLLCARDNGMESANPVLPALDFSCYCSSRDEVKGWVEVGSSMHYVVNGWPDGGWSGTHQVSVLFEPAHGKATGPWADPGKWRQLARSLAFKGTGGGNFYSDANAQAALLTGIERMCAVEFLGNIPSL